MARTPLSIIEGPGRTGILAGASGTEQSGDSSNHHQFANDGRILIHVRNTSGSLVPVITWFLAAKGPTGALPGGPDGTTVSNPTSSLAISSEYIFGPFSPQAFNQSDGTVYFNLDSNGGVIRFQTFHV